MAPMPMTALMAGASDSYARYSLTYSILVLGVVVVEEHDNCTSSSSSVLVVGGITSLIRFPSHTVPAASSDS